MTEKLEQLNSMKRDDAVAELMKACGSSRWAERMADERPFHDEAALLSEADRLWWSLGASDWLEAFSHHPKIGERRAAQEVSAQARSWSEEEQSGTRDASELSRRELLAANREYESRYGFIFIVCATGKTTTEMLALCRARLNNDAETELRVAAEEQRRITALRLKKLLES